MKIFKNIVLLSVILVFTGCSKDYLETAPTTSVVEVELFTSLAGAQTLLEGIHRATYKAYNDQGQFGQKTVDYALDCLADDFYPTERGYGWFTNWYLHTSHRSVQDSDLEFIWAYYYDIINNSNILLTHLFTFETHTDADANWRLNMMAQTLTYRAHSLYNLVQLYSEGTIGVPIPLEPNPSPLIRSNVDKVYEQITADLNQAVIYFNDGGSEIPSPNVSHINIRVNYAIHARVALTQGLWDDASKYAGLAKDGIELAADYTYGWNKAAAAAARTEWIWGAILIDEQQTSFGSYFSHMDNFFNGYSTLGNQHIMPLEVYNSLNEADARKVVNSPDIYYAGEVFESNFGGKLRSSFKYTGKGEWTNDYLYIKAGEMYLIEAEALYRQGDEDGARVAINALNLARLYTAKYDIAHFNTNIKIADSVVGESLLHAILMYRRAELWGDGQRWYDLKRLNLPLVRNAAEQEYSEVKLNNIPAGDKSFTFLIPRQEMDANPNMTQNTL